MNVVAMDVLQDRRDEYDVTDTVRVSDAAAVRDAVQKLFGATFPGAPFDAVWLAFHDFERLFNGGFEDYVGCDTSYHDRQHTLDMVLAMARLIHGHERGSEPGDRLGPERAALGLITALFHDAGYVRHRTEDAGTVSGAEFTLNHVSRSARFLRDYLPRIGMAQTAGLAAQIVHFTGYEVNLDNIELEDPRDCVIGHLMGTADLLAQMADRCYLEKCRDRLFPEFVLGGVALVERDDGSLTINYRSARDLLARTFAFYEESAKRRMVVTFNRAYRYMEVLFGGSNPYMDAIQRNLEHLSRIVRARRWELLRRRPPCFTVYEDGEARMKRLAVDRIRALAADNRIRLRRRAGPASHAVAHAVALAV